MPTDLPDRLLQVWETQHAAHPVARALHALAAARPDTGWDAWLHAPVGTRDGALLSLHEALFGGALHTTTGCPHCGERLESDFHVRDVRAAPTEPVAAFVFDGAGHTVACRLPTSDDLLRVTAAERDAERAVQALLRRCVQQARCARREIEVDALPADVVDALGDAMAAHDPEADLRIALQCPACGGEAERRFDIVTYFWAELDDWAQRTLADVHTLARAYGWTEAAILALSPTRRRAYLDMVAA